MCKYKCSKVRIFMSSTRIKKQERRKQRQKTTYFAHQFRIRALNLDVSKIYEEKNKYVCGECINPRKYEISACGRNMFAGFGSK